MVVDQTLAISSDALYVHVAKCVDVMFWLIFAEQKKAVSCMAHTYDGLYYLNLFDNSHLGNHAEYSLDPSEQLLFFNTR